MRVATWNINGLRARLDFLVHWLRARRPDLVALQETKLPDDQFPVLAFEAEGYSTVFHGQKAWNGVAILSRGPARVLQAGLPGQSELGARLLTAEVGGLELTSVYCPNGKHVGHDDFPLKLDWLDALAAHLAAPSPERMAIVGGDFNICPTSLDTWSEERHAGAIFHTDEERSRFRALLDCGLSDLYRQLHPEERSFSWWDYRGGAFHRNLGLRIDFLLGTAAVRARLRSVEIDRDYRKKKQGLTASDHAPVIAELDD